MADSKETKTGQTVGGTAGGAIGTAIGGPLGGVVGAYLGSKVGGGIGATFEKDNDTTYTAANGDLLDKATGQVVGHQYPDGSMVLQGKVFAPGPTNGPVWGVGAPKSSSLAQQAVDNGSAPKLNNAPGIGTDSTQGKTGGGAMGTPGTGTTPNLAAWNAPASAGYGGTGYESDQTKSLKQQIAQLQSQQYTYTTIQTPAGPQQIQIPVNNPDLNNQLASLQAQLTTSQKRDSSTSDTNRLAQEADAAGNRAGPTLRTTTLDFSAARPLEQRQTAVGDLQQQQAAALMAGTSGAGQADLINRLNADLEGKAPSLAQIQLEEGRDAAMRNALSIANSARGNTMGLAQLEALRANQATMQDATRQAAALRAQEYATARDALGGVLSQQRGQGIQEQNIAATELGQTRSQDLQALADKYNNAVQQGQLTDADARAQLSAELQQRGMNDQQVQFFTQQYFGQQNRAQDTAIDAEKTRLNTALGVGSQSLTQRGQDIQQNQYDTNRTDKYIAAGLQGASTLGQTLTQSGSGNSNTGTGTGVQSSPGASTTTTPAATGYGYGTDSDPDKVWKDDEAA